MQFKLNANYSNPDHKGNQQQNIQTILKAIVHLHSLQF